MWADTTSCGNVHYPDDHAAQRFVFATERVNRMSRSNRLAGWDLDQDLTRHSRVKVTRRSDLFHWHPFGHQFLFHGNDFGIVGLLGIPVKLNADSGGKPNGVPERR